MDDKTLDNIFKTAFKNKSKISQEEGNWEDFELMLKKRVRRKKFFFFQWNRFNIYYVGILLACLVSGSFVYCQNYLWNPPDNNNGTINTMPVDTSFIPSGTSEEKNTLPITQEIKNSDNANNKPVNTVQKNTFSRSISTVDSSAKPVSPEIIKDTVSTTSTEPTVTPVVNTPPVVVMRRKKTVVLTTPQDTVIKIDTVKIKKGRKK